MTAFGWALAGFIVGAVVGFMAALWLAAPYAGESDGLDWDRDGWDDDAPGDTED